MQTCHIIDVCAKRSPLLLFFFVFNCHAGYKAIKRIGQGTFSEVVKTLSLKDLKFYACKTLKQTINRYVFCDRMTYAQAIGGAFLEPYVCGPLKHESAACNLKCPVRCQLYLPLTL